MQTGSKVSLSALQGENKTSDTHGRQHAVISSTTTEESQGLDFFKLIKFLIQLGNNDKCNKE